MNKKLNICMQLINIKNRAIGKVFCLLFTSVAMFSCQDLELNESTYVSKTYQFSNFARVKKVMTDVYSYLQPEFDAVGETMIDCASDDAVYASVPDKIKTFYDGSWSSMNPIDNKWDYYYKAIRSANYFLENCPEDFPDSQNNHDYSRNIKQLRNYPHEARALRAYYHFELLKRYQNIVIVDRVLTEEEVNGLEVSTYDETVEWIVNELKEASKKLPTSYSGTYFSEIGRVTRGFALAARVRALLYAASPLNNKDNNKEKWAKAAQAAKDFLEYNEKVRAYSLLDFSNSPNADSKAVIFSIRESASSKFERANFPIGMEEGKSGICPTLNLIEAFDLADGNPFEYAKHKELLLDPSKRDPRLKRYIISNGDKFKGEIIQSYYGGKNGLPLTNASPTSFYLRKFIIENTSLTTGNVQIFPHNWPVFRYSEVFLNYAEALFEATGNPSFKGSLSGVKYKLSPLEAVNKVRTIYGMPELKEVNPNRFRKRLRNERRVELCFEGHRFWDIRRWKIGNKTQLIYGLRLSKKENDVYSLSKEIIQERCWNEKMNYYPLPITELSKNTNLIQNDGWI